jgi:hypothetical protein
VYLGQVGVLGIFSQMDVLGMPLFQMDVLEMFRWMSSECVLRNALGMLGMLGVLGAFRMFLLGMFAATNDLAAKAKT